MQATSPSSILSADKSRRPRFSLADDTDDDEDVQTPSRNETSPRHPPSIVISGEASRRSESRDRHVGFAAAPIINETPSPGDAAPSLEREREGGTDPEKKSPPSSSENSYPPTGRHAFDKPEFATQPPGPPPAQKEKKKGRLPALPGFMAWIPRNFNWKGFRPVVRSSIAAWCGLLLMLCGPSQRALGQASFLVLIVSTISPASQPIASQLETVFFQIFFVSLGWAWACLALAIAHASRSTYKFTQAEFQAYSVQRFGQPGMTAAQIQLAASEAIFRGEFIEAAPGAVCAIFLGAGCGFFLWLRGYAGPGPLIFGVIFAMILLIITLTIGALFPYAYYSVGTVFFYPFAAQEAIILACTFLVFPETLAHQFTDRLIAALQPLQTVIRDQKEMLRANPRTSEWLRFQTLKGNANAAVAAVGLLGASEANLSREVSFGRVNGRDLSMILQSMRILVARTSGFVFFYEIVEKHLHRDGDSDTKRGPEVDDLVVRLGRSRAGTPNGTPTTSRPQSLELERDADESDTGDDHAQQLGTALQAVRERDPERNGSPSRPGRTFDRAHSSPGPRRAGISSDSLAELDDRHSSRTSQRGDHGPPSPGTRTAQYHQGHYFPHAHRRHHRSRGEEKRRSRSRTRHGKHSSSHASLPGLLHDVLHPQVDVRPVGVVESTVYADLEDYLSNPRDEEHLEEIIRLLCAASEPLIGTVEESIVHLIEVLHRFKSFDDTWRATFRYNAEETDQTIRVSQQHLDKLKAAITEYRDTKRLDVVRPFAKLFDPFGSETRGSEYGGEELQAPSHRGLFWAFQYEHCLIGWSEALVDIFETVLRFEKKRRRPRLWFPNLRKAKFRSQQVDNYADEDPEDLRELDTRAFSSVRNPDYKAPQTWAQHIGVRLDHLGDIVTRRDVLFGVKMAIVIGLCSMPAMFPTTSLFFYRERGVWVLIMICLTANQFLGDVLFGYVVRVFGTLAGTAIGLCLWSIAAQRGRGNPFAVGAVCAVAFPPIFFYRVHMQPIMTAILPSVTSMLVIGYSWQNAHNPSLSSIGYGWNVAWRRCVCVMIGITVAFISSFIPPSSRQKVSIRRSYAKVVYRMGDVVCQIISFANCKAGPTKPPKIIVNNLAALRLRVNRTVQARAMARYEISLQGAWPSKLYAAVQTHVMEMLDLLGQLAMVISKLDQRWTKALLHRSQLANPRFLQDLLSSLQLISLALDRGTPLPYIYNPLLERFLRSPEAIASGHANGYGYEIQLGDDDVEDLPRHVDFRTICSLEYLRFSSGVSHVYAIINRLDRLMFTVKSLVGENYLLYGLDPRSDLGERQGLLDEDHFHGGPDSRRSSFERTNSSLV
ncbi:hypothetical protein JCM8115_001452 [Rhodotorula mucilaginosa]